MSNIYVYATLALHYLGVPITTDNLGAMLSAVNIEVDILEINRLLEKVNTVDLAELVANPSLFAPEIESEPEIIPQVTEKIEEIKEIDLFKKSLFDGDDDTDWEKIFG